MRSKLGTGRYSKPNRKGFRENTPVYELEEPSLTDCGLCEQPILDESVLEVRQTGRDCKDQTWAYHSTCKAMMKPLAEDAFVGLLKGHMEGKPEFMSDHIGEAPAVDKIVIKQAGASNNRAWKEKHTNEVMTYERK